MIIKTSKFQAVDIDGFSKNAGRVHIYSQNIFFIVILIYLVGVAFVPMMFDDIHFGNFPNSMVLSLECSKIGYRTIICRLYLEDIFSN